MSDRAGTEKRWIGTDGKVYRRNPLCQLLEQNCPGVCGYCLEYGKIDDSLEVKGDD